MSTFGIQRVEQKDGEVFCHIMLQDDELGSWPVAWWLSTEHRKLLRTAVGMDTFFATTDLLELPETSNTINSIVGPMIAAMVADKKRQAQTQEENDVNI